MTEKRKHNGIKSFYVFIPTIIVLSLLYALILVSTIFINLNTARMYKEVNASAECDDLIGDLQSGCSKLSEIATGFMYQPTIQQGPPGTPETLNVGPLNAYILELNDEKMQPKYIMQQLEKFGLSEEINDKLELVISNYTYMKQEQAHSFRLLASIDADCYKHPVMIQLINSLDDNNLTEYPITEYEAGLSDDEKKELAFSKLLTREYASDAKGAVSSNIRDATNMVNEKANNVKDSETRTLKWMRGFLWGSITLMIIINALFFYILLKRLVLPINNYSKKIEENERLDSGHALYEANVLADAYNSLLDRHKEFENELIKVAEIDSLTRLPNRYCYNNFLKNKIETEEKSVCAFLFDINNLKYTNDTFGHAKGDELIKNAANCIKECFAKDTKNCFRIGGDEFVCILENIDEETINKYLSKFSDLEDFYNVSIAVGYSYIADIREVGYEKLISEADQKMYENKAKMRK